MAVDGSQLTSFGLQFVGKLPYKWGGTSLTSGADCSGFVQQIYNHFGIAIPRTTFDQVNVGLPVSVQNLQPGDLIFYAGSDGTSTHPGHVAMYLGNGEILEEPHTGADAQVVSITAPGAIVAARRVNGVMSNGNVGGFDSLLGLSSALGLNSSNSQIPSTLPTFDLFSATGVAAPNPQSIGEIYGLTASFIQSDPELQNLFANAVANGWSQDQFIGQLQETTWWQKNSSSARQVMEMKKNDPAQFNQLVNNNKVDIQKMAAQMGVPLSKSALTNVAQTALMFNYNTDQIRGMLDTYLTDSKQGKYGGYAGQVQLALQQYSMDMGIPVSQKWIDNAVSNIVSGAGTTGPTAAPTGPQGKEAAAGTATSFGTLRDYMSWIQTQAALAFPAYAQQINQGVPVGQLAEPYAHAMNSLWEVLPGEISLNNPTLRAAMTYKNTQGQPEPLAIDSFQTQLRQNPRWLKTNNAREAHMGAAVQVLSDMGLISPTLGSTSDTSGPTATTVRAGSLATQTNSNQGGPLSGSQNFSSLYGDQYIKATQSTQLTAPDITSIVPQTSFTSTGESGKL